MTSKFLPHIDKAKYDAAKSAGDTQALFDLLCQPIHEELYKVQDFNFVDELSKGQQIMVTYDYIRVQVKQGGFIQLIQNGYVILLAQMPEWLTSIGANDMAEVMDDVLKVYVLNREVLDKEYSVEDFAKLYDELREFEDIDNRFEQYDMDTIEHILNYADGHLEEFIKS